MRKEVPFHVQKSSMLLILSGKKLKGSPQPPEIPAPDLIDHFKKWFRPA